MTHLDDLAFCLLAAGGAMNPEADGTYLLYTEPETSSLIVKLWTGGQRFGPDETVAESVRPNTASPYILAPPTQLVVYVSSSDELRIREFDDESDEWADDKTLPQYKVHPKGKVAAALGTDNHVRVIFQDSSKSLILLDKVDGSWKSNVLPANVTEGSAIGASTVQDKLHVFYVSAQDNCLHYVIEEDGGWMDVAFASCVFDEKLEPKRVMVTQDTNASFEIFVMTERRALLKFIQAKDKLEVLGKMNEKNEFEPGTSAECFGWIYMPYFVVNVYNISINASGGRGGRGGGGGGGGIRFGRFW